MTSDESLDDGATARIAQFVCDANYLQLPESTRHAARRAFVNIVGCCLGGARHEIVEIAAGALLPLAGTGAAALLGRPERTDVLTATLLNCMSSAAYSFDDTHAKSILHPSGAVAACLLSIAEQRPMNGEDFLLAFTLGVEVAARVCMAVSVAPASGDIGWSQTGIAAGIGAAAAAAKALGLDAQRTIWALGIAALDASGFRAAHGTMSATWIFGHAAQSGLRAAILAKHGLDGPRDPLGGKYGYASLFATKPYLAYLSDSLGAQFEVDALAYKPYPCGIVIHPSLDAALAWRQSEDEVSPSIAHVALRVHPSALALGYRRHPAGVLEAKVSLYHWVAAALVRGRAGLAEGQEDVISDPQIMRLRDAIEAEGDSTLGAESAILTVTREDGQQRTIAITANKGSIANPMSDDDLSEKFKGQASLQLASEKVAQLLNACWRVDQLGDVAEIARLSQPD